MAETSEPDRHLGLVNVQQVPLRIAVDLVPVGKAVVGKGRAVLVQMELTRIEDQTRLRTRRKPLTEACMAHYSPALSTRKNPRNCPNPSFLPHFLL